VKTRVNPNSRVVFIDSDDEGNQTGQGAARGTKRGLSQPDSGVGSKRTRLDDPAYKEELETLAAKVTSLLDALSANTANQPVYGDENHHERLVVFIELPEHEDVYFPYASKYALGTLLRQLRTDSETRNARITVHQLSNNGDVFLRRVMNRNKYYKGDELALRRDIVVEWSACLNKKENEPIRFFGFAYNVVLPSDHQVQVRPGYSFRQERDDRVLREDENEYNDWLLIARYNLLPGVRILRVMEV
jgi:hypothetical protein